MAEISWKAVHRPPATNTIGVAHLSQTITPETVVIASPLKIEDPVELKPEPKKSVKPATKK